MNACMQGASPSAFPPATCPAPAVRVLRSSGQQSPPTLLTAPLHGTVLPVHPLVGSGCCLDRNACVE
jgi:hypothetical protein